MFILVKNLQRTLKGLLNMNEAAKTISDSQLNKNTINNMKLCGQALQTPNIYQKHGLQNIRNKDGGN